MTGNGDDPIDDAIRATAPVMPGMAEIPIILQSTGRPALLAVPTDVTDGERMELAAWILTGLRQHIDANAPRSPLIVARGRLPT